MAPKASFPLSYYPLPMSEKKFLQFHMRKSPYYASPKGRKLTVGFLCQGEAINHFLEEVTDPICKLDVLTYSAISK